jgi:hypothetical protein
MSHIDIPIILTPRQIAFVLRKALSVSPRYRELSPLNSALTDFRLAAAQRRCTAIGRPRAQALFDTMLVLMAFPCDGSPARVEDVADTLQMTPASVLRDVVTWDELGLLEPGPREAHDDPKSRAFMRTQFLVG